LDGERTVTCSRGVRIVPDVGLEPLTRSGRSFDLIVLPGGGEGSQRFAESTVLGDLLRRQEHAGRGIAAICAAPLALARHGVGGGARLTAYPSCRGELAGHGHWDDAAVVESGNLVTSRGPGTAFEFAFALVRRLRGTAAVEAVRAPMHFAVAGEGRDA
jgi:protein DJ-1